MNNNTLRLRRLLVGTVLVLNLLAAAIAGWAVIESRLANFRDAERTASNLALVLAHDISTMLDKADEAVQTVADVVSDHGLDGAAGRTFARRTIEREQARRPDLNAVRIADANGDIIMGKGLAQSGAISIADRDYFRQLQANPAAGLVISEPQVGRVGGQPGIVLARALTDRNGKFAGVAYASLLQSSFERLFATIDMGANGAVTLRKESYALVARQTRRAGSPGETGSRQVSKRFTDAIALNPGEGNYLTSTSLDGIERSNSYRRLAAYPFYIIVGVATVDQLEGWWRSTVIFVTLLALFSLTTLLLAVSAFRILTQREHAEAALVASENRFRVVFERAPVGVATVAPDGNFIEVNQSLCELLGYSRAELLSMDVQQVTPAEFLAGDSAQFQRMLAGDISGFEQEKQYLCKDGRMFWAKLSIELVHEADGRPSHVIAIVHDIDQRKRAEAELVQAKEGLERKVEERTRKLVEANAELQTITYTLAHDLRSPARHVVALAAQLVQTCADAIPERGQHWLMLMSRSAERQAQLVDDMLAYMKLGMKSVERETVGMNQLVADLIEQTVEGRADRDKFNFRVAGLADVEGDRALLRVILANLLANAVKYCATQPFPQIEVGWQARGPQAGAWFVRDNGVGFDAARAVKLFGMFQRFHDHAEFPGYGIGLAIVRRLVEKHGGQVWAESSPGKGATFFFTLQAEPGSDEYTPA